MVCKNHIIWFDTSTKPHHCSFESELRPTLQRGVGPTVCSTPGSHRPKRSTPGTLTLVRTKLSRCKKKKKRPYTISGPMIWRVEASPPWKDNGALHRHVLNVGRTKCLPAPIARRSFFHQGGQTNTQRRRCLILLDHSQTASHQQDRRQHHWLKVTAFCLFVACICRAVMSFVLFFSSLRQTRRTWVRWHTAK